MHKPRFLALPLFPLAILPFQDQPEVVKNQRKLELQQRQESYKWGTFAVGSMEEDNDLLKATDG